MLIHRMIPGTGARSDRTLRVCGETDPLRRAGSSSAAGITANHRYWSRRYAGGRRPNSQHHHDQHTASICIFGAITTSEFTIAMLFSRSAILPIQFFACDTISQFQLEKTNGAPASAAFIAEGGTAKEFLDDVSIFSLFAIVSASGPSSPIPPGNNMVLLNVFTTEPINSQLCLSGVSFFSPSGP